MLTRSEKFNKQQQKTYRMVTIQKIIQRNFLNSFKYLFNLNFVFIAIALIIIEDL